MEVSFVIANYNGKEVIEQCIESILNQDYPKKDYEVIIKISKNASKNRNEGTEEAKGEILAFIDGVKIILI